MTAGRKRPTPRARRTSGENDDAQRTPQHDAPIGRNRPRPVEMVPPGTELPPSRRPGRPGGSLSPRDVKARIAAGWAAKARRDEEET